MTSTEYKDRMLEFVAGSMKHSRRSIIPVKKKLASLKEYDITSRYIIDDTFGGRDIVLMVDRDYPEEAFKLFYNAAVKESATMNPDQDGPNVGVVFDRDEFFRSAAERYEFKKTHGLSLKHYTDKQLDQMIFLKPAQMALMETKNRGAQRKWMQFYQSQYRDLREELVSYQFEKVRFDYSHINPTERFKPDNKDSKKLYIWNREVIHGGKVTLENGLLQTLPLPTILKEAPCIINRKQ